MPLWAKGGIAVMLLFASQFHLWNARRPDTRSRHVAAFVAASTSDGQ